MACFLFYFISFEAFLLFFARAIETCISCMSLKTDDVGTAACAFWWRATLLAPPVWKKHNRPLTGCLQSVGGDRQMIPVRQAPPPLVPPSGDSWIAHNKFHMWQLVGVGMTSLHWFDLIPSKKSARIITNHFFCYCLFVYSICLFFFVNDCSCSFSFSLFFSFQRLSVCACVCKKLQLCLTMGDLTSPCNKMVVIYVAYWQKNWTNSNRWGLFIFKLSINVTYSSVPGNIHRTFCHNIRSL